MTHFVTEQAAQHPVLLVVEDLHWCDDLSLDLLLHLARRCRQVPLLLLVTIQFESHTVELWAIYLMEHDPDVLEFYDQPQTFKLRYQAKSGTKTLGHYYTSDFLVLRKYGVGFEEWKTEDELHRQAEKQPFRYYCMENGTWRCGVLFYGLSVGLMGGLGIGGLDAFVRHFILRAFLWRLGFLPWNLVPFLDEAAKRLLLRKIGGSYTFVHRQLLDYFASLEKKEP